MSCSLRRRPRATESMDDARAAICRQSFCVVWLLLAALAFSVVGESAAMADDGAPKATPAAADAPSFDQVIGPLFQTKCGRCHGKTVQKAELALHTVEGIRKGGESGPVIVPGKSAESLLYEKIHQQEMPPDGEGRLTAAEVESVQRWIDGGASFGASTTAKSEVTQHDVIPILLLRCTVCHGRQKQEAGLDLRTRAGHAQGGKVRTGDRAGQAGGEPDPQTDSRGGDAAAKATHRGDGQAGRSRRGGEARAVD